MDDHLFQLINSGMANPLFDVLMPALTHHGYLLAVPLALYALIAASRTRAPEGRNYVMTAMAVIVVGAIAVPLADSLGDWLKVLIGRPRPCRALEGVRLVIKCPSSFSLPSGHAITSFAGALPFFLLTRPFLPFRWRIVPLVVAGLVAFSRIYLGVHYPSDVLAGALLGGGVAGALCWVYEQIDKRVRQT